MMLAIGLSACATGEEESSGPELAPESVAPETVEATQEAAESLVPDNPLVHLRVPAGAREGLSLFSLDQDGTGSVTADIVTLNGGSVVAGEAPGGVPAFRFPAYDEPALGRRAILRVRNAGDRDVLAPGTSDFEFGAEFRHDKATTGDPTDNGDNLIQRGLFGDGSQYKIDIDKKKPSCRIEGADGAIQVKASRPVEPDTWYAVRCSRRGGRVELLVMQYEGDRLVEKTRDEEEGRTGSITSESIEQPMSVGGKLTVVGEVVERASDQFNGAVSNPFLIIEE